MPCRLLPLLNCVLVLLGAVSSAVAQPSVAIKIVIQPAQLELHGPGERHGLLISTVAADGSVRDVTHEASFQSQQPGIVRIEETGECVAGGNGQVQVTVTYQGLTASVPVTVAGSDKVQPPSFLNDVQPVLTRLGCNQGACHGKNSGQNGFRLSLRGYAPEWDYEWLTREYEGRRINKMVPEASLILRKPLGDAPHQGGKLFSEDSRTYQTLLRWIRSGTPGPDAKDVSLEQIEILPGNRILKTGQEQQLLVRARFSDGRWKDVTWLSKFDSSDATLAAVNEGGKVKMLRPGETAVRATFQGQVAVILFTAPYDQSVRPELYALHNNFIDEHVFNKLKVLRIEPAELCDDATFIRRVYLDTIGLPPTADEVRAFLKDTRSDKRSHLIDALLQRPEFVDFWTLKLDDLLQNRKESDHDVRGPKGVRSFHQWLRQQVVANRPWNELARDILTVKGSSADNPAVGYFIVTVGEHNETYKAPVVSYVAQTFLGTRIGCAQCHNHPLEKYTQDDYYHFAAFFSRIRMKRQEPKKGPTELLVSAQNPQDNKNPIGVVQPRTGKFLAPRPLDRSELKIKPGDDPRQPLAEWITDPKNEYFSGAMVNRLWAHFFSVGLVEPIDDLRASNPPSNPELWRALVKEFVAHKYDLKHMVRVMLNSRAYQLGFKTRPGNERDKRFYSHYYARRLPAEVMLDTIGRTIGVAEPFPGYPAGIRAVQVPDPAVKSYFLALFGKSQRITACACETNTDVTLPQLLHLYGGDTVGPKLRSPQGRLAQWLKEGKSNEQIVEEMFLTALARPPHPQEWSAIRRTLQNGDNRIDVLADIFWAVLNAKEFAFNH